MEYAMDEIWVSVPERPKYQFSNLGNIRSRMQGSYKPLKPLQRKSKYTFLVTVDDYGVQKFYSLSKLVATHFVPKTPYSGQTIGFKDGDRANCAASNLYWVERKIKHKKLPEDYRNARAKRVVCVETGKVYCSMRAATKAMGKTGPILGLMLKSGDPNRSFAGYHWRYAKEGE